jgi:hypothetical protein
VQVKEQIEVVNYYAKLNFLVKRIMDFNKLRPTYIRYEGTGELILNEGKKEIKRKSNFIYEMLYAGRKYIKQQI